MECARLGRHVSACALLTCTQGSPGNSPGGPGGRPSFGGRSVRCVPPQPPLYPLTLAQSNGGGGFDGGFGGGYGGNGGNRRSSGGWSNGGGDWTNSTGAGNWNGNPRTSGASSFGGPVRTQNSSLLVCRLTSSQVSNFAGNAGGRRSAAPPAAGRQSYIDLSREVSLAHSMSLPVSNRRAAGARRGG